MIKRSGPKWALDLFREFIRNWAPMAMHGHLNDNDVHHLRDTGDPMSDDEYDESGYDLVMPFLPVQSKGGPYDDDAFVAGYQMGLLDAQLGGSVFDQGRAVDVACREQADLIAMRHGFVADFTEVDGWACISVRRAVSDPT